MIASSRLKMLLTLNLDYLLSIYFYFATFGSVFYLFLGGAIKIESIFFNLDLGLFISFLLCYFILLEGAFMKLSILC